MKAEHFARKSFQENLDEDTARFIILHCKTLEEYCHILAPNNKEFYTKAAWLHDLGRIHGEENHAQKSLEVIGDAYEIDTVLRDCILNHGSSARPETEEGKLFQLCDKLSLLHPDILSLIEEREPGTAQGIIKKTIGKLAKNT